MLNIGDDVKIGKCTCGNLCSEREGETAKVVNTYSCGCILLEMVSDSTRTIHELCCLELVGRAYKHNTG